MIPPIAIAALVGGGLIAGGLVIFRKKDGAAAPGGRAGNPTMSPAMQQAFDMLMSGSDPDAMETSATALEPFGFLSEAARLRAQAAAIRKARLGGVQAPPPPPPPAPASRAAAAAAAPSAPNAFEFPPGAESLPALASLPAAPTGFPKSPIPAPAVAALPSFAVVTTNDQPPSGDLFIVPAPNAAGIQGIGAEKGGIVTVIKQDALGDGVWSQVVWAGGSRLGPVSGFAKSRFLRPSAVGPLGTAIAGSDGPRVRCVAPSGCRLRVAPSAVAAFRAFVCNGDELEVLKTVDGEKLESFSPGRGGWALVGYRGLKGWLPSEWLVRSE